MKKSPIICLLLAFFMLISVLFPVTSSASSPAVERGCNSLQARVPLGGTQQLTETAKAVLLYELNTDTLVYAWNPDQRIDPSGMVKILTALVALEHGNLEDEVTVDRDTLNSVGIGIVSANLQSGEVITVRDLLYCVMVKSANDACAVLAKHIGGTQAEFVAMMNEKARQLGCTDSHLPMRMAWAAPISTLQPGIWRSSLQLRWKMSCLRPCFRYSVIPYLPLINLKNAI